MTMLVAWALQRAVLSSINVDRSAAPSNWPISSTMLDALWRGLTAQSSKVPSHGSWDQRGSKFSHFKSDYLLDFKNTHLVRALVDYFTYLRWKSPCTALKWNALTGLTSLSLSYYYSTAIRGRKPVDCGSYSHVATAYSGKT